MKLRKTISIFLVFATTITASFSFAQGTIVDKPPSGGPRRQIATIVYAGLGGAILGLSSLSFYGRPQDKLVNIAYGAAIGIVFGTLAVTYSAATNPDDFYGGHGRDALLGPGLDTHVVASENNSAPAWSASFEVLKF